MSILTIVHIDFTATIYFRCCNYGSRKRQRRHAMTATRMCASVRWVNIFHHNVMLFPNDAFLQRKLSESSFRNANFYVALNHFNSFLIDLPKFSTPQFQNLQKRIKRKLFAIGQNGNFFRSIQNKRTKIAVQNVTLNRINISFDLFERSNSVLIKKRSKFGSLWDSFRCFNMLLETVRLIVGKKTKLINAEPFLYSLEMSLSPWRSIWVKY